VIPDNALMELVRRKPERASDVREVRFLPSPVSGQHGDRIAECVRRARELPPTRDEHAKLLEDATVRARIDALWLSNEPLDMRAGTDTALGRLLAALERIAGRVLINGFPTGVEVCPAMNHGGPYPATTDTRFTSVGTAAIFRFARPVCYQSYPDALLPDALKNANPLGLMRLVDGQPTQNSL